MTAVATSVRISLEGACLEPACSELAFRMHNQLDTPNYSIGAALMSVPDSLPGWREGHRTARKRADRSARLGYRFAEIDMSQHNDAIHEINTSLRHRQGVRMSAGYLERHDRGPLPEYRCDRHAVRTYGVLEGDVLRAYLILYRVGELVLISMILGHGDHLRNDVMYLLGAGMVAEQAGQGGWFYYNRFSSGTDGLRYFKERLGFREADVEWQL